MFELNPPNFLGKFAKLLYQYVNISNHFYHLFKIIHRNILIGCHIVAVYDATTVTIIHVHS